LEKIIKRKEYHMADTVLNESILNSIKKLLGINTSDIVFDQDIAIHINTVFANLVQMGIGPSNGYMITSENNEWKEFCGDDLPLLNNVKTYVYLKVKLLFDPPQASSLLEAINSQLKEIEWRMYVQKGGF